MREVLLGLVFAALLDAASAYAQRSTVAAQSGAPSDQILACQQKVGQLSEQVRPLQAKLSSLRTERKGISASGGEMARFKLANLDQEISHITKQLDGVNGQITAEKKRCDELAHKPSSPPAPPPPTTPPPRSRRH